MNNDYSSSPAGKGKAVERKWDAPHDQAKDSDQGSNHDHKILEAENAKTVLADAAKSEKSWNRRKITRGW